MAQARASLRSSASDSEASGPGKVIQVDEPDLSPGLSTVTGGPGPGPGPASATGQAWPGARSLSLSAFGGGLGDPARESTCHCRAA